MIKNLTPHPIHIIRDDDPSMVLTIEPEPVPARCSEVLVDQAWFDGVLLVTVEYGEVSGLPDYDPTDDSVLYIVSLLVRQACPNRKDLASPADIVRDSQGKIMGCHSLAINK